MARTIESERYPLASLAPAMLVKKNVNILPPAPKSTCKVQRKKELPITHYKKG